MDVVINEPLRWAAKSHLVYLSCARGAVILNNWPLVTARTLLSLAIFGGASVADFQSFRLFSIGRKRVSA